MSSSSPPEAGEATTSTTTSSSDPLITDEHDKYFTQFAESFGFDQTQKMALLMSMKAANFRYSTLDKLFKHTIFLRLNFTSQQQCYTILCLCMVIDLLPEMAMIRLEDLITALRKMSTGTDAQQQTAKSLANALDEQQASLVQQHTSLANREQSLIEQPTSLVAIIEQQKSLVGRLESVVAFAEQKKRASTIDVPDYVPCNSISELERQISYGFATSSPKVLTPQHLDTLFDQINTFMDGLLIQCRGLKTQHKIDTVASHPGIAVSLPDVRGTIDWSGRRNTQRSFTSYYSSSYSSSSQHDASCGVTPLKEDTLEEDTLTLSAGTTLMLVSTLHIIYLMRGHELLPGGLTKENREAAFELLSSFQRAIPTNPVDKSSNHVLMAGIPGFDKSLLHVILFTLLFHHKIDVALVSAASDEHLMCMHYRYSPTTQQGVIDANLPLYLLNPSNVIVLIDHRDYNATQSSKPYYTPQLEQFVHTALYNYQQHPPLLMSLRTSFFESPGRAPARARSVLAPIIYGLPCRYLFIVASL